MAVAGIDLGGSNVRGLLLAPDDTIIAEHRVLRPHSPDRIVAAVGEVLGQLVNNSGETIDGVGVGCAGAVDAAGVVHSSPNIPELAGVDLLGDLVAAGHAVNVVANDATAATWAESQSGAALGQTNVGFVALGTGIGAGFVLKGDLWLGANGFAGESGHMVVEHGGHLCVCGRRGCWEAYASGRALGRLAQESAVAGQANSVLRLAGGDAADVRGEHVSELVAHGDAAAVAILDHFGSWVGLGLTNLANVLDLDMFVVGGGLAAIGQPLIDATQRGYEYWSHDLDMRPMPRIVLAEHGWRAGAMGAAMLAR